MAAETDDKACEGCKISQGITVPRGGIIELPGNWTLNHYGGKEGFLGWMVLQPHCHRKELTDLKSDEANALGRNIQEIGQALRKYWGEQFNSDPVQKVYMAYFSESKGFHVHFHLIPRCESFYALLKDRRKRFIAWNIYKISRRKGFRPEYRIRKKNDGNGRKVEALMTYLRCYLHRCSTS